MHEADFVTAFVKGLNASGGWWAHKFSNTARGELKPCDMIAAWYGILYGIEAKMPRVRSWEEAREKIIINQNDLRPNQKHSLDKMEKKGIKTLVAAAVYHAGSQKTRAFIIPYPKFMEREGWDLTDMENEWSELHRVSNVGWIMPNGFESR